MKDIKLNVLNEQRLSEREMNELTGGCCLLKIPKPAPIPAACDSGGTTNDSANNSGNGNNNKCVPIPVCPVIIKIIACLFR